MSSQPATRGRLDSIDLLRGLVIVLMALDHARDFFGPGTHLPENLDQASAALFLTRWVTHFCAPVFVLLAGLGTALYAARPGRTKAEVSRFLWTRGLWLILLEVTISNLAWLSFVVSGYLFLQVIWVIGVSMILLALLVWLPRWAIATFALVSIAGHNLLDGVSPQDFEGFSRHLFGLLHARHWIPTGESFGIFIIYPLLPWPGVMALGYLLGPLFQWEQGARRKALVLLGGAATVSFVLLRWLNGYGDPSAWESQARGPLFTVLDFLNTTKYPPSLAFLLMTLGPALILLAFLENARGKLAGTLIVFGRVPLFFYLPHFYVLHLGAILWGQLRYGEVFWWLGNPSGFPPDYQQSLPLVYGAWILTVLLMLPLCRWFAGVKARRSEWWLRYL